MHSYLVLTVFHEIVSQIPWRDWCKDPSIVGVSIVSFTTERNGEFVFLRWIVGMLHKCLNVNELIFSWKRDVVCFLLLGMKESTGYAVTAKRLWLESFGSKCLWLSIIMSKWKGFWPYFKSVLLQSYEQLYSCHIYLSLLILSLIFVMTSVLYLFQFVT